MANNDIQILQFGTGNFLRAFIGSMVHELNEKGNNLNICIIQSTASTSLRQLAAQDYSYHMLEAGFMDGEKIEKIHLINCIKDGLNLPLEEEKFFKYASSLSLKWIISNVTEAGMVWKNEGPLEKFAESFPGRLTQWLFRRFQNIPQIETIILPCELLPDNGFLLKKFVLDHSEKWDLPSEFKSWIEERVIFLNSLVDRIVPGFPSHLNLSLKESDPFLVQAEPYSLWAIEGSESIRPNLPFLTCHSGVVLSEDISGFALRKVRILNASHTAMTGHGMLHGIVTVGDWIADKERELFLRDLISEEIIPTINLPREELDRYTIIVLDRFKNPFVAHKLHDISLNSIAKIKSRLVPIISDFYDSKGFFPPKLINCLLSILLYYLRNPDKIRDSEEVKRWFESTSKSASERDSLKATLSYWFDLSWNSGLENAFTNISQSTE